MLIGQQLLVKFDLVVLVLVMLLMTTMNEDYDNNNDDNDYCALTFKKFQTSSTSG
jgi:hypothetical protein